MTPNLHSFSPIMLFHSPTLFSLTPKVFSHTPTLLSCSPKILFFFLLINYAIRKTIETNYDYRNNKTQLYSTNGQLLTHAYGHRLADVHLAGFAPAFPLSFHDRKFARKPPVPIASVVMYNIKKIKT